MNFYNYIWSNLRKFKIVIFPLLFVVSSFASATSPSSGLDLSQAEGKVIYVDFWASWCAPCKMSFSYMNDLKAEFPEKDFQIILINLDKDKADAEWFLSNVKEPVPSIYNPKGDIARHYKVSAMPTSILIDRQGKIRYVHKGFHPEKTKKYTSHIKELINED